MLNELRDEIHKNAINHGFYDTDEDKNVLVKLMLIVSELGEACEAYRGEKYANIDRHKVEKWYIEKSNLNLEGIAFKMYIKDTFEDEIADAIIRLLDLCGHLGIDIAEHVRLKMDYNKNRPYKHNKKV